MSLSTQQTEASRRLLVRGSELILKGKNRPLFEGQLIKNIRKSLGDRQPFQCRQIGASHLLEFEEAPTQEIYQRLQKVLGVTYFAPVYRSELGKDTLITDLIQRLPKNHVHTFSVRTRRMNRRFPFNSQELNCEIGAAIQEARPWSVDLSEPDLTIHVEVIKDAILYHWERYEGVRGLPVGVSGKVTVLMSGGIDSPVAAFMMASRGCLPIYVHCHSAPYTTRASIDKVLDVVKQMELYHYQTRLYLVPFAQIQQAIVTKCPEKLRIILYRRFMVRLAEQIARREKSQALVTGDSVGQVSSQTLSNLRSVESVTLIPILRPLIGLDKQDITERARQIGTYDISIRPDQDCCSYLMPRKPATHTRVPELEESERLLDVDTLIRATLNETELRTGGEVRTPYKRKSA